jgi:hypothetical protein
MLGVARARVGKSSQLDEPGLWRSQVSDFTASELAQARPDGR